MFHSFTVQFFEILLTCLEFYISKNLMQTSFVLSFEVTKVFPIVQLVLLLLLLKTETFSCL